MAPRHEAPAFALRHHCTCGMGPFCSAIQMRWMHPAHRGLAPDYRQPAPAAFSRRTTLGINQGVTQHGDLSLHP